MKVVIIGAGPAGLTATYQLSKQIGRQVESVQLYEANSYVGGMSTSLRLWNQIVDLGPHRFFSNDSQVNQLWFEIVESEYEMVKRLTRIYYNKKFFYYPLKPLNTLKNLGTWEALRCVASYIPYKMGLHKQDTDTFEGWVTQKFGKRLFNIFFKTYTEKLWGIPCDELDADFAMQRIKKLSLSEAILSAINLIDNKKHKTLVDEFAYPKYGTGYVYQKMYQKCVEMGAKVYLQTPVGSIKIDKQKVQGIVLREGKFIPADIVISSMPLSLLVLQIPDLPEQIRQEVAKLRYRNTILVYLNVDSSYLFPDQWIYIHDKDLKTGRVTNFRNWLPTLYGEEKTTILCMEYWCYDEDVLWQMSEDALINLASQELYKTGLVSHHTKVIAGKVIKLHRSYPVYFKDYKTILEPVQDYINKIANLYAIGRYGAYKYNNQDHSIMMGIKVVENVLNNAQHDLWAINTDYDTYQEKGSIKEHKWI
ncbi:MAG: FAD-dependent oxidoreductase [Bacteroidia bacterium]|nr:FAD-dependent oxidoreductase [Bacteroidia bacterium]MDW8346436.1 FAD-dependent oxidoreductase [Bacteroidia bacterium]